MSKNKNKDIERRSFTAEVRKSSEESGKSRRIEGYAALYNSTANLGWFNERIEPGAFDEAVNVSDIRALLNHDPNHLLARTTSGTLTVRADEKGLYYELDLPESRNDVLEMVTRGDLNQSSFAFTVEQDEWRSENGTETRIIKRVGELFDVSPVTYPAYKSATVGAKRSYEQHQNNNKNTNESNQERRAKRLRLLEIN